MRILPFAAVLSLSLFANSACRPDQDDSQATQSQSPDGTVASGAEGEAEGTAAADFSSTVPKLDTCYKGDTWTCTVEATIVKETNLLRSKPLIQDFESSFVAREWSSSQAETGKISHDGFPDKRKEALIEAFPDVSWNYYAENVAMAQTSEGDAVKIAKQFVSMWKNSPGHLRNMLGDYQYLGVGVVRVGNSYYATQIFH